MEILEFEAESLVENVDLIPRKPGIYIFRDSTGYLYIGEAGSLRLRVAQHLDHSEGRTMAKRGRKKRDRKHSKANHGNRPNA